MSATAAPVYVRLDPLGGVWEQVGTRNGRATLRHTSALTDFPGHPLHGKPAEVHCSVGLLSRLTIPAAGPHAVVDAPVEASHGTAGASSPASAGGSSPVAALPVVAAVAPSTAATPIAAGREDASRVSGTDRGHTTAALEGHPARPFDPGNPAAHRGARNTDPTTSLEAAESITDLRRRADHDMVLHLLALHGPLTDFDLARTATQLTGRNVQQTSIGVRRSELRNAGLVCDSGFKGKSPSGARSIRWALTAQGAEVAA